MKITTKRIIEHAEEVISHDKYEVRLQREKGKMVTIIYKTEDGEIQFWKWKSDKDREIIDELSSATSNYITELWGDIEFA